jgi:hypothetical protein
VSGLAGTIVAVRLDLDITHTWIGEDETILLTDAHSIEHPDDIARILVNAGNPPTRLAVEQQNLEEHFLQLTSGISKPPAPDPQHMAVTE